MSDEEVDDFEDGGDDMEEDDYFDGDDAEIASDNENVEDDDKAALLMKQDMQEAQKLGYCTGASSHSLELSIWVGMDIDFIDEEKASTCGFYKDRKLVCKLVFANPAKYMSDCPTAENKRIMIRQTSDTDLDKSKLLDSQTFGLWWTLEQRLSGYLRSEWPSLTEKAQAAMAGLDSSRDDDVESLMGISDITDKDVAILALKKCKNDVNSAVSMLLDEKKRKAIEKEAEQLSKSKPDSRPGNLLISVVNYIKERIDICAKYCIVCNKEHPLELLKPTVCEDMLCNFQFVDLGLGINVESDIMHAPEMVDLLVCFTCAAVASKHFTPFPSSVRSKVIENGVEKVIEFKPENPTEIQTCLQKLPPLKELQQFVIVGKLKKKLDKLHPLLYKLLRWILGTNRSHLQKLEGDQKIQGITCEAQFVLKSTPPSMERKFQLHKKDNGGAFHAFHGSPFHNWHSILRNGLKNYSNTQFMTTGAAYGPGIYMAVEGGTSLGYAGGYGGSSGWNGSQFGQNLACMALCEVVEYGSSSKCLGKVHRPNCTHCTGAPYYRIEEEEMVCTRFLLLFGGNNRNANVKAADLKVPNSLKRSFKGLKKSTGGVKKSK